MKVWSFPSLWLFIAFTFRRPRTLSYTRSGNASKGPVPCSLLTLEPMSYQSKHDCHMIHRYLCYWSHDCHATTLCMQISLLDCSMTVVYAIDHMTTTQWVHISYDYYLTVTWLTHTGALGGRLCEARCTYLPARAQRQTTWLLQEDEVQQLGCVCQCV